MGQNHPVWGDCYKEKPQKGLIFMSELARIWAANDQGLWKKCPKYGIFVSGCTHNMECDKCFGVQKPTKIVKEKVKKPTKIIKEKAKKLKPKVINKRTKKNTVKQEKKLGVKHVRRIKRTATKKCSMDSGRFGSLFGN